MHAAMQARQLQQPCLTALTNLSACMNYPATSHHVPGRVTLRKCAQVCPATDLELYVPCLLNELLYQQRVVTKG
jgi:hypothetical protein